MFPEEWGLVIVRLCKHFEQTVLLVALLALIEGLVIEPKPIRTEDPGPILVRWCPDPLGNPRWAKVVLLAAKTNSPGRVRDPKSQPSG